MKLKSFLIENQSHLDFEYLQKFRDEISNAITSFENGVGKKGFRIADLMSEPDDETYLGVVFSNKILDIMLEVVIDPGKESGDEVLKLMVQFSIADAFTVGEGRTLPSAIKTYTINDIKSREEQKFIDGLKKIETAILEFADNFHDWYFDVTGEYGKVKLYIDYKSRADKPSIKALAGEFEIDTQHHQVY